MSEAARLKSPLGPKTPGRPPLRSRFYNHDSKVFNPQRRSTAASRKARPISPGETLHVVLRSDLAKGTMSLRKHESKIARLIKALAKSHGVSIYKLANVGNHIHIHLRVTRRLSWKGFISGLTGGIARAVGFRRGPSDSRSFWNARPYTRTVKSGYDFGLIQDYVELNILEACGVVPPRSTWNPDKLWNWRRMVRLHRES